LNRQKLHRREKRTPGSAPALCNSSLLLAACIYGCVSARAIRSRCVEVLDSAHYDSLCENEANRYPKNARLLREQRVAFQADVF
jgi:hypothetical protein